MKYRLQADQLDFRGTESNIIFMIISYDLENGFLKKTMVINICILKFEVLLNSKVEHHNSNYLQLATVCIQNVSRTLRNLQRMVTNKVR